MDPHDRPKLPPTVYQAIESAQINIDQYYWNVLQKLQVSVEAAKVVRLSFPDLKPQPPEPKRPHALRSAIVRYARNLLAAEATHYPRDEHLDFHLIKLGERVVERVMGIIFALENGGRFARGTLNYHGLSTDQMRTIATEAVQANASGIVASATLAAPSFPTATAQEPSSKQPLRKKARISPETLAARRTALVKPILENKGWSELDWANEANVAYHTAADYLDGKTNPYPSTRAKLAKSLGLSVQQLPR